MRKVNATEVKKITEGMSRGVLLNVLPAKSHREAHIPNSYNIPFEADGFVNKAEKLVKSKDQPIITYCASEDCDLSQKAAKKLEQSGFNNVQEFSGGINEWRAADYQLERQ